MRIMTESVIELIKHCISQRNLKYILCFTVGLLLGYKYKESIEMRNNAIIINEYEGKMRDLKDSIMTIKLDLKESNIELLRRKEANNETEQ